MIILEATASQDLWIQRSFFCIEILKNDINMLNQSNMFNDIFEEHTPITQYTINKTL